MVSTVSMQPEYSTLQPVIHEPGQGKDDERRLNPYKKIMIEIDIERGRRQGIAFVSRTPRNHVITHSVGLVRMMRR